MDELAIERGDEAWTIELDGRRVGEMTYRRTAADTITIDHTEVGPELRGRGAGQKLVQAAVDWARKNGHKIVAECPYAKKVFEKDPELQDVLAR
jgi:uncharacterized protein